MGINPLLFSLPLYSGRRPLILIKKCKVARHLSVKVIFLTAIYCNFPASNLKKQSIF